MNVKDKLREAINNLDPSKYYNQNKRIYNNYFGENNLKNLPFRTVKIRYISGNYCSTTSYDLIDGTIWGDDGTAGWDIKNVINETELKKIEEAIFEELEKIRKENEKNFFENGKTDI
ncbi:hypothetical protein [Capnocytophaga canis]|uniref:hypothetical protein n=1 Tax=Capnocytophaga canis TaxID=1848903 RepID=UPI0037D5759F